MKRVIRVNKKDGSYEDLELAVVTAVDVDGFIHIDKLKDGKWRLLMSKHFSEDIKNIDNLEIIRED